MKIISFIYVEARTGVLSNLCFGWVNPEQSSKRHTPSFSTPGGWQGVLFPLLPGYLCLFRFSYMYHLLPAAGSWNNIVNNHY